METVYHAYYLQTKYFAISTTNMYNLVRIFQCDLPKDDLVNNVEKMNSYCQEKGFDKWFETSAKENSNIDTAIQYLVGEVRESFYLFIFLNFLFFSRL